MEFTKLDTTFPIEPAKSLLADLTAHEREGFAQSEARGHIVIDAPEVTLSEGAENDWPALRISFAASPGFRALSDFVGGSIGHSAGTLNALATAENIEILETHGVTPGSVYGAYYHDEGRLLGLPFNPTASAFTGRLLCGPVWLLVGEAERRDREGG